MRRTFAALEVSCVRWKSPTSAVEATWVPPHSSRDTSSTSTIRTQSPYFSPKSAIAPSRSAPPPPVPVLLAEARHRAEPLRLLAGRFDRTHGKRRDDPLVHELLDSRR